MLFLDCWIFRWISARPLDMRKPRNVGIPTFSGVSPCVRVGGVEPPRAYTHCHLKTARLPFRHTRRQATNLHPNAPNAQSSACRAGSGHISFVDLLRVPFFEGGGSSPQPLRDSSVVIKDGPCPPRGLLVRIVSPSTTNSPLGRLLNVSASKRGARRGGRTSYGWAHNPGRRSPLP